MRKRKGIKAKRSRRKKSSKRIKWFYCDVWRENFYFFIGWDPKEFEAYLKKEYGVSFNWKPYYGRTVELVNDAGSSRQFIFSRSRKPWIIAHECIHAAMHVLERRGVKLTGDSHESLTYLVECLVREALK